MNELKLEILRKLEFGLKVTYNIVGVDREIFNNAVKELAQEGYVTYTPETHKLFIDDVNYVRITEKGKTYIQSIR